MLDNEAINLTRKNKELAEKTNLKIKYPEETPYVQGEAEKNMTLKVNKVNDQILRKSQRAQFLGHLKNSSYKMSYDDCRTRARLDNSLVIFNTNIQD